MTVLYGAAVVLRPIVADDIPRLGILLDDPQVAPWLPRLDPPATAGFAVDLDGRLVGTARYHEDPSRDYRHATVEVALDPAWHGKGLGADTLRAMARHLFYDRRHHRLVAELHPRNSKALRSYQRVGFRPVGLLRECEVDVTGGRRDALLLDLLKRDLQ
jgi:aminoglycoside 6'-N-acetyltransferase